MKSNIPSHQSNFHLYTATDGKVKVEVFVNDETVWLTQKAMAELFGAKIPAISKHPANVCETGELLQDATLSTLETVQRLPQKRIAELFDVDRSVVTEHLRNSLFSNELDKDSVCANFANTATPINSNCRGFLDSSTIGLLQ